MRARLTGLAVVVTLALSSHLVTRALLGQARRKPEQTRSQSSRVKRLPRAEGAPVVARNSSSLADRCNDKCSWVDISNVRVVNDTPGVASFLLNVETWQGARHPGVGGDFVAQVDLYPRDDEDGTRRLASVHSGPLGTVRGELRKGEIPLVLSMPPGIYRARATLVGMNTEWVRYRADAEPVQELPVHSLTTVHDLIIK